MFDFCTSSLNHDVVYHRSVEHFDGEEPKMTDKKKRHQVTRVRIIRPFKFAPIKVVKATQRPIASKGQSSSLKKNDTLEVDDTHVDSVLVTQLQDDLVSEKQNDINGAEQSVVADVSLAHFDSAANPYAFYVAQIPTMLSSLPSEAMSSVSNIDDVLSGSLTAEIQNAECNQKLVRPDIENEELIEQSRLEIQTYKSKFGMPQKDIQQARFGGQLCEKPSKGLKHKLNTDYNADSKEQINTTTQLIAKRMNISLGELIFWLSNPSEVLNTVIKADLNTVLPLLKQTSNIQSLTFAHLLNAYQHDIFNGAHTYAVEEVIARLISKLPKEQISLSTLLALAAQAKDEDYAFVQWIQKGKSKSLFKPLSAFTQAGYLDELKGLASNNLFYAPCNLSFAFLNKCLVVHQQCWRVWLHQPLVKSVI